MLLHAIATHVCHAVDIFDTPVDTTQGNCYSTQGMRRVSCCSVLYGKSGDMCRRALRPSPQHCGHAALSQLKELQRCISMPSVGVPIVIRPNTGTRRTEHLGTRQEPASRRSGAPSDMPKGKPKSLNCHLRLHARTNAATCAECRSPLPAGRPLVSGVYRKFDA